MSNSRKIRTEKIKQALARALAIQKASQKPRIRKI